MPRISAKAERFTESVIREMNRLAVNAGAVSLAQGFPDFECPPELKAAVTAAVEADINQYAITWGSKPLRDAIAASTPRHFPGWGAIDPETQVTVTCLSAATACRFAGAGAPKCSASCIVVHAPSLLPGQGW